MPFSDEAWAALDALGEKVDADLVANDVRLTMGGEPTFVSVDDYQSAEWNTAALGPMKRIRADDLIRRLCKRFAPGGLLHYGQGKWYPGEPLPRWAFSLFWRRDGVPIWRDERADRARSRRITSRRIGDAQRLAEGIAARLGIVADYVQPAFEDPADRMLKQGAIPENIDPGDPQIDDPRSARASCGCSNVNLAQPAGFVLPRATLGRDKRSPDGVSEMWRTRRGRIVSDAGRFPARLSAAAAVAALCRARRLSAPGAGRPVRRTPSRCPIRAYAPDRRTSSRTERRGRVAAGRTRSPGDAARIRARTQAATLCRCARRWRSRCATATSACSCRRSNGSQDYLELLAVVEATAAELGMPVQVEGYTPPPDPRLNVIKVTPDPGVIEVNIHPAASWREAVEITRSLYEEAHLPASAPTSS